MVTDGVGVRVGPGLVTRKITFCPTQATPQNDTQLCMLSCRRFIRCELH